MGWVARELQRRKPSQNQVSTTVIDPPQPASPSIWEAITRGLENDVSEFNDASGPRFRVARCGDSSIQVTPAQPPITPAVLDIDRSGIISVTCPIDSEGTPRHGTFKEMQGRIVSRGDFVGQPKPSGEPMTVEDFSEFVLKPILFPHN